MCTLIAYSSTVKKAVQVDVLFFALRSLDDIKPDSKIVAEENSISRSKNASVSAPTKN
jgi:hypothetical protein